MNFAPSTPWYRRFVLGDRWPNKTSWKVLEAEIRGSWLLVERHTSGCTCSYCRGEHGHKLFWMPAEKARGWRVINLFHKLYVRWTPHPRNAEPRYSKEANFQVGASLPQAQRQDTP
jgi:hypothetical protein